MNYFFEGFAMLEEKKNKILSIISQYEFSSVICAAFAITSWRNNRGAQESCLSINEAMVNNKKWGNKKITKYPELQELFDLLFPILQITPYDDPVLADFGEIKLNYCSRYYSVITGTGHTQPIFASLQFLESLSKNVSMDNSTLELLNYSENMICQLQKTNALCDSNPSMVPKFECPSEEYFKSVTAFFCTKPWEKLNNTLLEMLSANSNTILKSHFYLHGGNYYPLFNPSLVIDYFTDLLSNCTQDEIGIIVKKTLFKKLYEIYGDSDPTDLFVENCLLLSQNKSLTSKCTCFVVQEESNFIVFLDCNVDCSFTIGEILTAFNGNELSVVDLDDRKSSSTCKAYHLNNSANLHIICYDEYLDVDKTVIKAGRKGEKRTYSAIDLMFMIMFSENIMQFVEFDNYKESNEPGILSWGGASDYYITFLREKGFISKGAIEYTHIYIEFESAAAYIFSLYMDLNKFFPFHLSSNGFMEPECWNIEKVDKNLCKLAKKPQGAIVGDLFVLENRCTFFWSYDFKNIAKDNNREQIGISAEACNTIIERFFAEFDSELSAVPFLNSTHIQLCCHSLSNQDSNYIMHNQFFEKDGHMIVDFEVNCDKLLNDISTASNRQVEYKMILELFNPVMQRSKTDFSAVFKKINDEMPKKKNINTTAMKIEYFFNLNTQKIKETEVSRLSVSKQISKICASANVAPGIYTGKDATAIVRKIQKSMVNCFEEKIIPLGKDILHAKALSALASEVFTINANSLNAKISAELDESMRGKSREKVFEASETSKGLKVSLSYLIETNLFLLENRGSENISEVVLSELLSFAQYLVHLQNSSDLCYHTDSKTELIIEEDYRIGVKLGESYDSKHNSDKRRRLYTKPYDLNGDETDKEYIEKAVKAFGKDTGIEFSLLNAVMYQLSQIGFPTEIVWFKEIAPNVIMANTSDLIKDYISFADEDVCYEDIKKAYDFLTVDTDRLKSIGDNKYDILPIWEREKRDNYFSVKPLYKSGDNYIFSPILMDELRKRWIGGFSQFYLPYEVGLSRTIKVLDDWKSHYEHLFSSQIENLLKSFGCDYCKHDVDIRREDRSGNHPTINELGDYDVIGLNISRKTVYIIECKVLRPIGSVFEHSNQQKRFFFEEKFDEKFQKRINYFSKVFCSFFSNLGYEITDEFRVMPFMVVNKVFSSYYKDVGFAIVTYDELKYQLENDKEN